MSRRPPSPPLAALLAVAALLFAIGGQLRFDQFRTSGMAEWSLVQQGLLAFLVGSIALLWSRLMAANQTEPVTERLTVDFGRERSPEPAPDPEPLPAAPWPPNAMLFSGAALLLIALLLRLLLQLPEPLPADTPAWLVPGAMTLWLGTVAIMVAAWWPPRQRLPVGALVARLQQRWPMVAALALITLLAAWLRLHHLATLPFTVNGDEASIALDVRALMAGAKRMPFMVGWGSHPILSHYLLAAMQWLLGTGIGSLRLVMALFGIAAVLATGLLGWVVGGRRLALASALLLATMPWHIHFSRVLLMVILDSWTVTATIGLLLFGMARPTRRWAFLAAGLISGFGQYVYIGSRLLPLLLLCYLLYLALFQRRLLRANSLNFVAMALCFVAVAAPLYLYGYRFPDLFNQRLNAEGIFQNGWLAAEAVGRGQSQPLILLDQFRRALFGFAFYPDRGTSWAAGRPMAEPLVALGLIAGLAVTLTRLRDWRIVLLHGWFWAVVLTGGVLTLNPPTSSRLSSAAPVVCLFAAIGWRALAEGLARAAEPVRQPLWANTLFALVILLTGWLGLRMSDRTLHESRFGGSGTYAATQIARTLATEPPGTTVVVLGNDIVSPTLSTFEYLLGQPPLSIEQPLAGQLPATLPPTGPLLFVVTPERADDLATLQQAFPGARPRPRYHATGELLYQELFVERAP